MKNPSQEDLLGYVLGALDADQHAKVQKVMDRDPQIEERLLDIKSSMAPLELLDETSSTRPGLARRTCEMMAAIQKDNQLRMLSAGPALEMTPSVSELHSTTRPTIEPKTKARMSGNLAMAESSGNLFRASWSLNDVLVLVASLAVLAALLVPAISYSRYHADRSACQSNFVALGTALLEYSDIHDGRFIAIPTEGNLAVAGSFAPMLKDAGLIEDDNIFACAGVYRRQPVVIPTCVQIENSYGDNLRQMQRRLSGDYGYSLGYLENEVYIATGNDAGFYMIIVADKPSNNLVGHKSANHRGYGQNCLFADGHCEFVKGHAYGDDPIYMNDYDLVGPGTNRYDCVIGASFHSPMRWLLRPE